LGGIPVTYAKGRRVVKLQHEHQVGVAVGAGGRGSRGMPKSSREGWPVMADARVCVIAKTSGQSEALSSMQAQDDRSDKKNPQGKSLSLSHPPASATSASHFSFQPYPIHLHKADKHLAPTSPCMPASLLTLSHPATHWPNLPSCLGLPPSHRNPSSAHYDFT
jgi:hypothetical protein